MDRDVSAHFDQVIALARTRLTDVRIAQNDITAHRAILEVHGTFQGFDVRLKEIYAAARELYSYYLLRSGRVIVGFDNYADPRAIKMRFGGHYKQHWEDLVPHRHGRGKKTVQLTTEYTAKKFLESLEELIRDS